MKAESKLALLPSRTRWASQPKYMRDEERHTVIRVVSASALHFSTASLSLDRWLLPRVLLGRRLLPSRVIPWSRWSLPPSCLTKSEKRIEGKGALDGLRGAKGVGIDRSTCAVASGSEDHEQQQVRHGSAKPQAGSLSYLMGCPGLTEGLECASASAF